jgi:hypothetical protein
MRITAVRLVMEGYMGKEVADLCNLHRQSVATYVKKFNEGGIDALLERKCGPGRPCFFTAEQQNEPKQVILNEFPFRSQIGMRFLMDHFYYSGVCAQHVWGRDELYRHFAHALATTLKLHALNLCASQSRSRPTMNV